MFGFDALEGVSRPACRKPSASLISSSTAPCCIVPVKPQKCARTVFAANEALTLRRFDFDEIEDQVAINSRVNGSQFSTLEHTLRLGDLVGGHLGGPRAAQERPLAFASAWRAA